MEIIKTIGNKSLLDREKTLFLCSKHTPVGLYADVFRWTDSLTEKDTVCCFNSTEMESEVLKALLVGRIPTILFVMDRFADRNNMQIEQALKEKRMLIVVLKRDEPKGRGATPRVRNEYVLSLCQHVVCGYVNRNGGVFPLLAGRKDVEFLINEKAYSMAAEPDVCRERWTVAEDKVLLRMFYADMGIHAIHKKLHRTHIAVFVRIRSITQSEEVLKGREFEDYVLGLFDVREDGPLVLQEWQSDKALGEIKPENNSNPDLVFRYYEKEFAVECKWRGKLERDLSKDLFPPKKIEDYKSFSETRKMPVTIVLGVGGEPCNPEQLYAIPLESIASVVSGTQSLTSFRCTSQKLDASSLARKDVKAFLSMKELRKQYPNAYKPWNKDDDDRLLALYRKGTSIKDLSQTFQRNEDGILSRIRKLTGEW